MEKNPFLNSPALNTKAYPNQTQSLSHPRDLFSISDCESTYIPQIIVIILICTEVISISVFFCIKKYKFRQENETHASSREPELQSMQSFEKKEYQSTEISDNSHNETSSKSLQSYHLFLSLKKASDLERLKIVFIYINSLIIQLWLILFLFRNKRHNYFNSTIIALITSSASGVFTYMIFGLKVSSLVIKKLIYIVDFGLSFACVYSVFNNDFGCVENYWLYSYVISVMLDILAIQSLMVFIRKIFASMCKGSQNISQIEK
ncbi:hypothetical protein SteCoe_1035 [Stentor coeruleus]|uniref:Transmembrane protein n=1 Tax=Stentor coeruleus TaxID=5963 RepID=A0A1R2D2W2_9CILI|nr:hypothetical protein SteCoe_1035 [Stentor coeruleus]